jgi:hypothetical protein
MPYRPPKNDRERLLNLIDALAAPEDEDDALDEALHAELARRGLTLESWAAEIRARAEAVVARARPARPVRAVPIAEAVERGRAVAGAGASRQR